MYRYVLIDICKIVADSIVWVCRGTDLQTTEDANKKGRY